MVLIKDFPGEIWKKLEIEQESTNEINIHISNYGRVKSFSKLADGRLLQGSMQEGYRVLRLKLYSARDEKVQQELDHFREQIALESKKINETEKELDKAKKRFKKLKALDAEKKQLEKLKKKYKKAFKISQQKRTSNVTQLVHRFVAKHFCKQPSEEHNIVIHLDFNKLNNYYKNLKWVNQEQCTAHQQNSPLVIEEKKNRKSAARENSKVYKLTSVRVMLIKKKIAEGMSLRALAKQFKVTETQIRRIKSGENWGHVQAAR